MIDKTRGKDRHLVQREEMDLLRLRQATATEHAATEDSVPLMSDTLTRAGYVETLRHFYCIVDAWDRWADVHVPLDLRVMLQGRRRAALLADDLHALGEPSLPEPSTRYLRRMEDTAVAGDPRAVFLGRMYVMEGSTLGGQFIAKHVGARLGLLQGKGTAFFSGYGTQTASRWKEFKAVLAALPESDLDTVIASARNMFALFGEAMRTESGTGTGTTTMAAEPRFQASNATVGITP